MSRLTIKMNTDNAAFDDPNGFEIARILHKLANDIETCTHVTDHVFVLRDINGNIVGQFTAFPEN